MRVAILDACGIFGYELTFGYLSILDTYSETVPWGLGIEMEYASFPIPQCYHSATASGIHNSPLWYRQDLAIVTLSGFGNHIGKAGASRSPIIGTDICAYHSTDLFGCERFFLSSRSCTIPRSTYLTS
jgi:hypothetical protein